MIGPLLVLPSVAAGALALAGQARPGWLVPVSVLAVGSAVAVVALDLLPSAIAALGPIALVVMGVAFVAPWLLERMLGGNGQTGSAAVVLVAAHQFADGAQMGALGNASPGVMAVLALHGAPLVAMAVLAAAEESRRAGGVAFVLLVSAITAGLMLARVAEPVLAPVEPWMQAAVGGMLLHVFTHDVRHAFQARTHPIT
ncbi:MAG: hypothetical protein R3F61_33230 [Myxococcota bacterium]